MEKIKIVINGEPMGKQRPRATKYGKHARVYTPKETTAYENKVVNEYRRTIGEKKAFLSDIPLYATIIAYYKLQSTHFGKKGINQKGKDKLAGLIPPTQKPDCDNIAKICLDALNDIAYEDDSQVVGLLVIKKYDIEPRVEITIEELPNFKREIPNELY